jgi:ribonuclease R
MRHRIGEEYDAHIASVAPFGLFIELKGLYIEGLVHVTSLKNDYYEHDAKGHRLVGSRNGTVYSLGDKVRVKVVRVNLDERKIDLELIERGGGNGGSGRGQDRKPTPAAPRSDAVQHRHSQSRPNSSAGDSPTDSPKKSRSRRKKR